MIYLQSSFFYLISIVATIGLSKRLKLYLEEFFSPLMAVVVAAAILLHPLTIDAYLAPNPKGIVSFWLLLEALFCVKENKWIWALILSFLAALFNICYSLFPLYFLYKIKPDERRKFLIPGLIYLLLLGVYFGKLAFVTSHNPLTFFSYYLQNIIMPISLSTFTSSLYEFSPQVVFVGFMLLLLIIWREEKNKISRSFWPFLFLPLIGVVIHQWTEPYKFWSEVIQTSSNFLAITFALLTMVSIQASKKLLVPFLCFFLVVSYFWGVQWRPYSKVLKESVLNLPENYKELAMAKRALGWELLNEGKFIEGRSYLEDLSKLYPNDKNLKEDLEMLKSQTNQNN